MDIGQINHERFKNHLRQSTKDVFLVAHHLHRQGYGVYVPPFKVASNLSQIGDNQDEGDLFFEHNGKRLIVEVKTTNTSDFTDVRPHRFSTFFVCAVHAFEKYKDQPPSYYFIVNKSRTYVAVINVKDTFPFWQVIQTEDRRYVGYKQKRYACPTNLVTVQRLIYE